MSLPVQQRILTTAVPGPESQRLHARRQAAFADGFGVTMPVFVAEAGGGIVVDVDGNHLVDLASGIAVTSVGASHPDVVAAVQAQAERFTHTCFMVTEYEPAIEVAERLNRLVPGDVPRKTGLFTTGAEAVENAVKIARTFTGRPAVVVLSHAYHGRTLLTMTMTSKNVPYKEGFGPFAPEVYRVPSPYPFRTAGGDAAAAATQAYDALVDTVLTQLGAHNVAAIVAEPIQGEGGFIELPEGYLARVADFAREHGILLVVDEIQSGLGRTGAMFAHERDGVVADLVTTAKALAGGMPLSAVTGRADVMDAVAPGGLGGTYAGNPLACAAAVAAIDVIEREDLCARARRIEELVKPRLEALVGPGSIVGDVRGRGAMLAMEVVRPGTLEPDADATRRIAAACHAQGVIALTCGTYGNVVRLLPPLVIGEELLTDAIDVLVAAVASVGPVASVASVGPDGLVADPRDAVVGAPA